jgi:hypothetical protein
VREREIEIERVREREKEKEKRRIFFGITQSSVTPISLFISIFSLFPFLSLSGHLQELALQQGHSRSHSALGYARDPQAPSTGEIVVSTSFI